MMGNGRQIVGTRGMIGNGRQIVMIILLEFISIVVFAHGGDRWEMFVKSL